MFLKNFKFILICLAIQISITIFCFANRPIENKKETLENQIAPTEDLMREHGLINRIVLIYGELVGKMSKSSVLPNALLKSTTVIQDFIQNYHEKLEEDHIFPLFEKAKQELKLVKTLRYQHKTGREITTEIKSLVHSSKRLYSKNKPRLIYLVKKFIRMYRPHAAREDTVLFPKVRSLISEEDFKKLGEKFESYEYEQLGEEGFSGVLKQVEDIEKDLEIYALEQFTH